MCALTELLPGSAGLVRDNLENVMRHRGTMSWVGIAGLLWSAGKGFGAVTRAVNRALGAEYNIVRWKARNAEIETAADGSGTGQDS